MRTIKRECLSTKCKSSKIKGLCLAYCSEKNHFLDLLKDWKWQALLDKPRKIRDILVKEKYKSHYKLQARVWKMALEDSVETWNKYWQSLFVRLRPKVANCKTFTEDEKHYAYWILKGYDQFSAVMTGKFPDCKFLFDKKSKRHVSRYIQRNVKRLMKSRPQVKKNNSVKLDPDCYRVFEQNSCQYISLMTIEPRKRVILQLKGKTQISGNVTVLSNENGIKIHFAKELKKPNMKNCAAVESIDFGYTEVMTDTCGNRYGENLGAILSKATEQRHTKMQKRHRLHSLEKSARKSKKAAKIRKNNLGRKKLTVKTKKVKAALKTEINRGINELIKKRKPSVLVTENLRNKFSFEKSKKENRKFASWVRGLIQDRVIFKSLAEGFRHEQVNPAYGSQTCPNCGYVDFNNRKVDKFKCLNCGHEDLADRIAAMNILRRYGDQEISLHMTSSQVKAILLERFHRRLEAGKLATVPGRSLETVSDVNPQHSVERVRRTSQPEENHSIYRTVNQTAKQNEYVLIHF